MTPPKPLPEDWDNSRKYRYLLEWREWKDNPQSTLSASIPEE